jgi:hypothetical protein
MPSSVELAGRHVGKKPNSSFGCQNESIELIEILDLDFSIKVNFYLNKLSNEMRMSHIPLGFERVDLRII